MRLSTTGLPHIKASSTEQLGLRLARNALNAPVRTEASDNAARILCHKIIEVVGSLNSHAGMSFLFSEDFYTTNGAGKRVVNGAAVYRSALLDVLGTQPSSVRPIHERVITDPETGGPYRRWEWYGAGVLQIAGSELLVLEGKTQRWQTRPREEWKDYREFGAVAKLSTSSEQPRLRPVQMNVFDTLDELPIDRVKTGDLGDVVRY